MDIHNYRRRLEKVLEKIRNSDISEDNKKTLADLQSYLTVKGLSLARIEKYMQIIYFASEILNKPFNDVTKEDIIKLMEHIHNKEE